MSASRLFKKQQGGDYVHTWSAFETVRPSSDVELYIAMQRTFPHKAPIFRYDSARVGKSALFSTIASYWQRQDWSSLYQELCGDEPIVRRMRPAERDVVFNWFGQSARQLGKFDEAELIYRDAIEICASSQVLGWLLTNLAGALMRLGRYPQALHYACEARVQNPTAPEALCNVLCAASLLQKAELCERVSKELLEHHPEETTNKQSLIGRTLRNDLDLMYWRRHKSYIRLFPELCVSLPRISLSGELPCVE